jgi:protocatechuate 3,4-dioxygenase beta subunit
VRWNSQRAREHRFRSDAVRRRLAPERLEARQLLAADPIHIGVVYLETDYLESDLDVGSDSRGDRFIVSFSGGAEGTELSELRIITDKDGDGLSVGDPIYDTASGGRGKNGAHDFQVVRVQTADGRTIDAVAEVQDGGQELVLKLSNFRAGDRLEFTVDVDEILRNAIDLAVFNDRLDVITSGQEFQDAILEATFEAPHYETSHADSVFLNDYGDPADAYALNLPPDEGSDVDSRPNRSAAAVAQTRQVPKPISISGNVWLDNDLDMSREISEQILSGIELALWQRNNSGNYTDTGHRAITGADGKYEFPKSLELRPGDYRVVQTQPAGLFSVGALPGTIDGQVVGSAVGSNTVSDIVIPLGGQMSTDNDFAEAAPASIAGYVYRDDNDDGRRDANELGVAGVTVRLVPIHTLAPQAELTVTTAADGSYAFRGLSPGEYEVIEVDQPANLADGRDTAGSVGGVVVGVAENPGDRIRGILLAGDEHGIEYNFGEIDWGSLSGSVFLAAPGEDCSGLHDGDGSTVLAGVRVELQTAAGNVVSQVTTAADGSYHFEHVPFGNYRIAQFTPVGLLDGGAHPGTIDGVRVGTAVGGGLIQDIILTAGGVGLNYDFCEASPALISGYVYHDQSNDGVRGQGEEGIGGTVVSLVDSDGNVVATATTDAGGRYEFAGVVPGEYALIEAQPANFLDGIDAAGTIDGITVGAPGADGDSIRSIVIKQGQTAVEYNFGELVGGTLGGLVHIDTDGDCLLDAGEQRLAGVTIRLLDGDGVEVATTVTDADGRYRFENLNPGEYTLVEEQPAGLFEGGARSGSAGGVVEGPSRIGSISLASGAVAVDYVFCENPPSEITGAVFDDYDGDCVFDADEVGIADVVIELYDDRDNLIGTTTTDAAGHYRFGDLPAGDYTVRETQPGGWLQGGQRAGSAGGDDSQPDVISQIPVGWGRELIDYNFCELAPASLSGRVWQEADLNRRFDPGEMPVPGVLVELIDDTGEVIAATTTGAGGGYRFDSLRPGRYSISQSQPGGLFHGGQLIGSAGGQIGGDDLIVGIELRSGVDAIDYDFPEVPPASLSGFVFQDGEALPLKTAPAAEELRLYRDGQLTADDQPLSGVVIELRDSSGQPLHGEDMLPGAYSTGPIWTTTDDAGFYRFVGLRPGTYHVYEIQPEDYLDGLDSAGTSGGLAINRADTWDPAFAGRIEALSSDAATNPNEDAILDVLLIAGSESEQNNFSEIIINPPAPPAPPTPPDPDPIPDPEPDPDPPLVGIFEQPAEDPPVVEPPPIEVFDPSIKVATFSAAEGPLNPIVAGHEWTVTWHLSLINGGLPLGILASNEPILSVSSEQIDLDWTEQDHSRGRWSFMTVEGKYIDKSEDMVLGVPGGTALVGDFDGDGVDEIVMYSAGTWFVDLNGDGRWDSGDLWMRLGTSLDRPVVGDWDGDGKDDIGIFGRQWQRDPQKIVRDPGLPDPANKRRRRVENRKLADSPEDRGEDRKRLLRRGDRGQLRADEVDHVFQYGEHVDLPVVGDWNGDGIDQIGVFRGGIWTLDIDGDGRSTGEDRIARFGRPGDRPIVGDFNGDGIDEIAVIRGDKWIIDSDGDGKLTGNDQQIEVPRESKDSQPVTGDWDGDGRDDPGYYDEAA